MSKSLNRVSLIGNVGNDPEMRETTSGKTVANFSIATNRTWKDGTGNQQEKTEWHRCVAWDKLADIIGQYVKKGDRLYVEGAIEYGSYDKDGTTVYTATINVRDMIMLGGDREQAAPATPAAKQFVPSEPSLDDLPF